MAGEISIRLMQEIRGELGDEAKKLITTDPPIFQKLDRWQREVMTRFHTTIQRDTVTLTTATEYSLDENILKVVKAEPDPDNSLDYYPYYDAREHKLKLLSRTGGVASVSTGDIIYLTSYIKPLEADKISRTVDPIIGYEYYEYLKELVLSEYEQGRPQEEILKSIKGVAQQLKGTLKTGSDNPFQTFKW